MVVRVALIDEKDVLETKEKTKDEDEVCGVITLPASVSSISIFSKISENIGAILFLREYNKDSSVSKAAPYQKRKERRSEPRSLLKRLQFALARFEPSFSSPLSQP